MVYISSIINYIKYEYFSFRRKLIYSELKNFLDYISTNKIKPSKKEEDYFNNRLCKMLDFTNKALNIFK